MNRFFAFTRLALGWDWFIGPPVHHDRRRRTTQTLAMFTKLARMTALGNAWALVHAYLTLANAFSPFMPDDLAFAFPPMSGEFAVTSFRAWVQAQLCVQSLSAIHRRMLRIAQADN